MLTTLTYTLNDGPPQRFESNLFPADAQYDLIFAQDFSQPFLLRIWLGPDADTTVPADYAHEHNA